MELTQNAKYFSTLLESLEMNEENTEWRNTGIRPTIAGVVDAIAIVPILYWCIGASLPRFIAICVVIACLSVLKRYGFTTLSICLYFRARLSSYLGGGQRTPVRGREFFSSIDKSHF